MQATSLTDRRPARVAPARADHPAAPAGPAALLRPAQPSSPRRRLGRVPAWVSLLLLLLPALIGHVAAHAADTGAAALAGRVAALAADPSTVRMKAEQAVARLQPIVPLTPQPPSEAARSYTGSAPDAGVAWTRLEFQAGQRRGSWLFLQLEIGLDAAAVGQSPPQLADALVAELTRRMGKPKAPATGTAERLRIWQPGHHRVVTVRSGTHENPLDGRRQAVVLVEVAVEQGEAD